MAPKMGPCILPWEVSCTGAKPPTQKFPGKFLGSAVHRGLRAYIYITVFLGPSPGPDGLNSKKEKCGMRVIKMTEGMLRHTIRKIIKEAGKMSPAGPAGGMFDEFDLTTSKGLFQAQENVYFSLEEDEREWGKTYTRPGMILVGYLDQGSDYETGSNEGILYMRPPTLVGTYGHNDGCTVEVFGQALAEMGMPQREYSRMVRDWEKNSLEGAASALVWWNGKSGPGSKWAVNSSLST
jgi:hypothetical protein